MVSEAAFLRRYVSEFKKYNHGETPGKIVLDALSKRFEESAASYENALREKSEQFEKDQAEGKETELEEMPIYYFINMTDVTIFAGSRELEFPVWRCLVSSVDGFMLGSTTMG